jgi:hypothetical protein
LNLREGRANVDLCEEDNQYYKGNAECRNEKEAFHRCSNIGASSTMVNGQTYRDGGNLENGRSRNRTIPVSQSRNPKFEIRDWQLSGLI